MSKCMNCGKGIEQTEGKRAKLYCSNKCKTAFNRKAHIVTEPLRNTPEQHNVTPPPTRTIIDCNGKEHPIDFDDRRRVYELLESWAEGNGTEHQRRMGQLARSYRVVDMNHYLGYDISTTSNAG